MKKIVKAGILTVIMALTLSSAHAANLAPVQVFTDELLDGATTLDQTPQAEDLTAGFIAETDSALLFTWKVVDFPDQLQLGTPHPFAYFWEFALDDDGAGPNAPQDFSLRVAPTKQLAYAEVTPPAPVPSNVQGQNTSRSVRVGGGSLQGNCTRTQNLVSCRNIAGAVVDVTVDPLANTITAAVRRLDLRGSDERFLAKDGATLIDKILFNGISACTSFVVVTSAGACDQATMDFEYVLGSPRA